GSESLVDSWATPMVPTNNESATDKATYLPYFFFVFFIVFLILVTTRIEWSTVQTVTTFISRPIVTFGRIAYSIGWASKFMFLCGTSWKLTKRCPMIS